MLSFYESPTIHIQEMCFFLFFFLTLHHHGMFQLHTNIKKACQAIQRVGGVSHAHISTVVFLFFQRDSLLQLLHQPPNLFRELGVVQLHQDLV